MEQCAIKRRTIGDKESKRSVNFKYKLTKLGEYEPITVCKLAFMAIHGILKNKPLYAWKKGSPAGIAQKDDRGKQPNSRNFSEEKINYVHKRIKACQFAQVIIAELKIQI